MHEPYEALAVRFGLLFRPTSLARQRELLYPTEGLLGTSSCNVEVSAPRRQSMNENLRQAVLRARLREEDVAARLDVDPKTVRRWIEGRRPLPRQPGSPRRSPRDRRGRPMARGRRPVNPRTRPEELGTVYPHRWAIPRETWVRFFASAEHEIGILAYSALFLAEDAGLLRILADKGRQASRSASRSATQTALT